MPCWQYFSINYWLHSVDDLMFVDIFVDFLLADMMYLTCDVLVSYSYNLISTGLQHR